MILPAILIWGPSDLGESCRRDICLNLEDMGFEIEASHHEVAIAQHEIDFKHTAKRLSAADNIITFKMVVKSIAQRSTACARPLCPSRSLASAVPVCIPTCPCLKMAKNAFYDPRFAIRPERQSPMQFIAGIMQACQGHQCAITNPLVNSYKRLVPGYEAPCYIAWTDLQPQRSGACARYSWQWHPRRAA